MAAATSDQISALSRDSSWAQRVQSLLIQQAAVVYSESIDVVSHATRVAYAKAILANPSGYTGVAVTIANRTNIIGSNITYNFSDGHIVSDVTDAAISSQIASDWNMLAGV